MCRPINFEYRPHPLLITYPNLYDVKCVVIVSYMSIYNMTNKICVNCFQRENPPNFKFLIGHGLIYGQVRPARCLICNNPVTTHIGSILSCNTCFCAYAQFMRIFREHCANEIAHLILDVDYPGVVWLSIYDSITGVEFRVDFPITW